MKFGVIDVGSNSVRLMMSENNKSTKTIKITRLAEGMKEGALQGDAIFRTANAVSFFFEKAKSEGADEIFIFATAAVRMASNAQEFTNKVKALTGADVDVISGEEEAKIGFMGALYKSDGGIIDIGGASTEIVAVIGGEKRFAKSLNVGVVRLKDACGQDYSAVKKFVNEKIKEYGQIPFTNFYGIGGTATSLASIAQELEPYDPNKVDGYHLTRNKIEEISNKLFSLSIEERKALKGLQSDRAEVIAHGAVLLLAIVDMIGIDGIIVSERDNLEGYLALKLEKR